MNITKLAIESASVMLDVGDMFFRIIIVIVVLYVLGNAGVFDSSSLNQWVMGICGLFFAIKKPIAILFHLEDKMVI